MFTTCFVSDAKEYADEINAIFTETSALTAVNIKELFEQIGNVLALILHDIFIQTIRKTCPCNIYPRIPHFYIEKLGYAGVYLFFLFLLQNIDCGYSLEPPRRGGSNVYPQSMF